MYHTDFEGSIHANALAANAVILADLPIEGCSTDERFPMPASPPKFSFFTLLGTSYTHDIFDHTL